jgi:hypothetical protein
VDEGVGVVGGEVAQRLGHHDGQLPVLGLA